MSKKTRYTLTCVYAGRRLISGKHVYRCFVRNGKEMLFKGVFGVSMGSTYRCNARRIAARPERVSDAEHIENAQWEAEDALVENFLRERRAARMVESASKPVVDRAVEALLPLVQGIDFFKRRALVSFLVSEADRRLRRNKK